MSLVKCLLSVMVVLLAAGCAVHAQDHIKVCGRDLIRLAVSSCGNPRLRRSLIRSQNTSMTEHVASEKIHTPPESEKDDSTSLTPHWYCNLSRKRCSSGGAKNTSMTEHVASEKIHTPPESVEDDSTPTWPPWPPWVCIYSRKRCSSNGAQDTSMKEHDASEKIHTPPESDEDDSASLAPHWYRISYRIRRSAAKLSDTCCEKGCTIQELIQFC